MYCLDFFYWRRMFLYKHFFCNNCVFFFKKINKICKIKTINKELNKLERKND